MLGVAIRRARLDVLDQDGASSRAIRLPQFEACTGELRGEIHAVAIGFEFSGIRALAARVDVLDELRAGSRSVGLPELVAVDVPPLARKKSSLSVAAKL
jgi:hypothetical protein